jgi:hypothetical protein
MSVRMKPRSIERDGLENQRRRRTYLLGVEARSCF